MAYIITAVGAGGKTTYLRQRAAGYLRQGKRVAVTTTTHIWPPHPVPDQSGPENLPEPDYFGVIEKSGKLAACDRQTYERICREYDVVLVEGDGSHCMPVKIPSEREPVIPDNTDEIAVIMGAHAIGRRIDVVCHRYHGCSREAVTAQTLEEIAEQYYLVPLKKKYPDAKVFYVLSRMPHPAGRAVGVVMASGFGRRYGGNKLLDLYLGKPLYCQALDHVRQAIGKDNTIVVTQYETILQQVREMGMDAAWNDQAGEGIAASIRLGTQKALDLGADAVVFFAADMPCLPAGEIRRYVSQFLASGKPYGCMVFGKEHTCTNPGAFRLKQGAEKLLQLNGDRGAMRIMKQEPWNIYYYQTAPEYTQDIDLRISPLPAEQNQTSSHQTDPRS